MFSCTIPITTPPFAVPSSFVSTNPVIFTISLNAFTCSIAFCPVVPSITINVSFEASGNSFKITLFIFKSSSIKYFLLCNLPAVSQIKTSAFVSFAFFIASYTTDAGSAPSSFFTISTFALFAHISSCSTAAALNVSPAETITFLPSTLNLFAIFPIVVVFPTPFTPTTKITDGVVSNFSELSTSSKISCISSFNACFTPCSSLIFSFFILSLNFDIISTDVSTPISDIIRISSNSSRSSSSTFLKLLNTLFIFSLKLFLVFPRPFFNLSKNPISIHLICPCNFIIYYKKKQPVSCFICLPMICFSF